MPLPKFSDDTPEMLIQDATLILEDATRHTVAPLSLRGIDLKLTPSEVASASGRSNARTLTVSGTASGTPARSLTFTGTISPDDGMLDLAIEIAGLEISPELLAAVPGPLTSQLHGVELYAAADATIHLSRSSPGDSPLVWSANVSLTRGRLVHELLPQAVTELAATVAADSDKLVVKQLTGKVGAADFVLACNRQGWAANAPLGLAGRIHGLAVNADLQSALPARLEKLWQRFRPRGLIDAEVQLTFDGQQWRPKLKAECRGLSLTDAEKFPYPLEGATGTVAVHRSLTTGATQLELDLVGMAVGRPIHITAGIDHLAMPRIPVGEGAGSVAFDDVPLSPTGVRLASATSPEARPPKPTGWVEVSGTGVPIHEQLLAALKPKDQPFVRSLRPQGLIDFRWRWERSDPAAASGDTSLDLKLVDLRDSIRTVSLSAGTNRRRRHRPQRSFPTIKSDWPRPPGLRPCFLFGRS